MSTQFSFCDSCLTASVSWCENIAFTTGLTANHAYNVQVTNHFGQIYQQTVTTDGSGNITLNISLFPTQFFNPYSGIFTLIVYTTAGVEVDITKDGVQYPCISFDVYSLNDAN